MASVTGAAAVREHWADKRMLLSRVPNNLPSNFAAHCLTVGHLGHELSSAVLALNSSFMSSKIN